MKTVCSTYTFGVDGDGGLLLENGDTLAPVTLAYETYGERNRDGSNAILLFHALSGSQHAAGFRETVPGAEKYWNEECRTGWWDGLIGDGRPLDTSRFFIICANYIGGCYGSSGPATPDPKTGIPYGSRFPWITIPDIVNSQLRLLDHLGINRLHAVMGASMGGLMALHLATARPDRVRLVVSIASGQAVSPLQRIHNLEQILSIEKDAAFRGGDYYDGEPPLNGMLLARMISHKTFVSLHAMEDRAGARIGNDYPLPEAYRLGTPLESYMLHQGYKFLDRFDPNAYLRIIGAWQRFDLLRYFGEPDFRTLFARCRRQEFLVLSISSDVCFYPGEQEALVESLQEAGVFTHEITVNSDKGHDAFLVEPDLFGSRLEYWLRRDPDGGSGHAG